MFKNLRIAVLVYILLFVAVGQYLTARRSTDWDETLWVDVYPVIGDGMPITRTYLDALTPEEFAGIETFFTAEAARFGVKLARPFRLNLAEPLDRALPRLASTASPIEVAIWSLRMRWLATRLQWDSPRPAADIVVFAVFHAAADAGALDRSTALAQRTDRRRQPVCGSGRARRQSSRVGARAPAHARRERQIRSEQQRAAVSDWICGTVRRAVVSPSEGRAHGRANRRSASGMPGFQAACVRC